MLACRWRSVGTDGGRERRSSKGRKSEAESAQFSLWWPQPWRVWPFIWRKPDQWRAPLQDLTSLDQAAGLARELGPVRGREVVGIWTVAKSRLLTNLNRPGSTAETFPCLCSPSTLRKRPVRSLWSGRCPVPLGLLVGLLAVTRVSTRHKPVFSAVTGVKQFFLGNSSWFQPSSL